MCGYDFMLLTCSVTCMHGIVLFCVCVCVFFCLQIQLQFFEDHGIDPDTTFFPAEEEDWLKKSAAHMKSPYGLLRAPWNYNPAPYLTRFHNVHRIQDLTDIDEKVCC